MNEQQLAELVESALASEITDRGPAATIEDVQALPGAVVLVSFTDRDPLAVLVEDPAKGALYHIIDQVLPREDPPRREQPR